MRRRVLNMLNTKDTAMTVLIYDFDPDMFGDDDDLDVVFAPLTRVLQAAVSTRERTSGPTSAASCTCSDW